MAVCDGTTGRQVGNQPDPHAMGAASVPYHPTSNDHSIWRRSQRVNLEKRRWLSGFKTSLLGGRGGHPLTPGGGGRSAENGHCLSLFLEISRQPPPKEFSHSFFVLHNRNHNRFRDAVWILSSSRWSSKISQAAPLGKRKLKVPPPPTSAPLVSLGL